MDDLEAVRRIKGGDMGGLGTLMERYQVKAARAAFLITQDEALARDIVQEVFLRICRRIGQFNESLPFEPYLMRSVVNASLNALRANRRLTPLDDDAGRVEKLLDHAASIESQVELLQLQHDILDALSRLSPRQRAVIVQRYYLDMGEREMALELAVAPGTIKWLLSTARQRLRRLLRQKGQRNE